MGFEELYNHIVRYNLHSDTGVDYPGEGEEGTDALGMLAPYDQWSAVQAYNVSFGQGVSVTPLQMTRFYGAIVNNGVECVPHFLIGMPQSGTTPAYGTTQVIENTDALGDMQSMLKTVVTDGTGAKAAIDGFNVAGKTSTAEIYDEENGGYRKNVYNLAFTGFLADSPSKLVCFVGANEVPGLSLIHILRGQEITVGFQVGFVGLDGTRRAATLNAQVGDVFRRQIDQIVGIDALVH